MVITPTPSNLFYSITPFETFSSQSQFLLFCFENSRYKNHIRPWTKEGKTLSEESYLESPMKTESQKAKGWTPENQMANEVPWAQDASDSWETLNEQLHAEAQALALGYPQEHHDEVAKMMWEDEKRKKWRQC